MLGTTARPPSSLETEENGEGRRALSLSPKNNKRQPSLSPKNAKQQRPRAPSKERVSAAIAFVRARNQKSPANENSMRLGSPRTTSSIRLPLSPRMNSSPAASSLPAEKAFFGSSVPPSIDTKEANSALSPTSSVGASSPVAGRRSRRMAAAKHAEYKAQTSPRAAGYPPSSPHSSSFASTTVTIAKEQNENDDDASSTSSESSIDTNVVLGLADFIDALNKSSSSTVTPSSEDDVKSDSASSVPSGTLDSEMLKNLGDFIDRLNHQNSNEENDIIVNSSSSSDHTEEVDSETLQNIASFIDTIARAKSAIDRANEDESDESVPASAKVEATASASEQQHDATETATDEISTVNNVTEKAAALPKETNEKDRNSPSPFLYVSSSEDTNQSSLEGGMKNAATNSKVEPVATSSDTECPASMTLSESSSSSPESTCLEDAGSADCASKKMDTVETEMVGGTTNESIGESSSIYQKEAVNTQEEFVVPVPSLAVSSSDGSKERSLASDSVSRTKDDSAAIGPDDCVKSVEYQNGYKVTEAIATSSSDEDLFSGLEPTHTGAEAIAEQTSNSLDTPSPHEERKSINSDGVSNINDTLDFTISASVSRDVVPSDYQRVQEHVEASDRGTSNDETAAREDNPNSDSNVAETAVLGASSSLDMVLSVETHERVGESSTLPDDHGIDEILNVRSADSSTSSQEENNEIDRYNTLSEEVTGVDSERESAASHSYEESLAEPANGTCSSALSSGPVSETAHGVMSSGSEWTEEICTSSSDQTIEVTIGTSEDYSFATKQSDPNVVSSSSKSDAAPDVSEQTEIEVSEENDCRSIPSDREPIETATSSFSQVASPHNDGSASVNRDVAEDAFSGNERDNVVDADEISEAMSDDRESYLLNAFLTGSNMDISIDPILPDPSTMESIDEDENIARFQERMSSSNETRSRDRGDVGTVAKSRSTSSTDQNASSAAIFGLSQDEVLLHATLAEDDSSEDQGVECTTVVNEIRSETDEKEIKESVLKALVAGETYEDTIPETISEDRESYLLNAFLAGSNAEISVDPILPDPSTMDAVDEEENIASFQERIASISNESRSQDQDATRRASISTPRSLANSDLTQINGEKIELSKDVIDVVQDASVIAHNISRAVLAIDANMDDVEEEDPAKAAVTSPGAESQESYLLNAFLLGSNTEISVDPIIPDPSTMESLDEDDNIERFLAKTFTHPEGATKAELVMLNTFIKDVTDLVENDGTPEQRQNLVKKAIRDGIPKDMIEEVIVALVSTEDASTQAVSPRSQEVTKPEGVLEQTVDTEPLLVETSSTVTSLGEELERILSDSEGKEAEREGVPTPLPDKAEDLVVDRSTDEESMSIQGAESETLVVKETDSAATRDDIDVMDAFIDKLAPREGASANEIELLSQFMKLSEPVLAGKPLSQEEETKLRQAAGGVGISETLLDKVLHGPLSPKNSSSASTTKTDETGKATLNRDENETGAYLSSASRPSLSSSVVEVNADDDAVEVSFDMSMKEEQLTEDVDERPQEGEWSNKNDREANSNPQSRDIVPTEPQVPVSLGRPPSGKLTVQTDEALINEDINRAMWTPVADFQDERYAMPLTPSSQLGSQRITSPGDDSFEDANLSKVVSPRSRLPRHSSRYSPTAKGLITPSKLGGSAAAAVISRWSPRRASRRRLPVKQQWKLSYRERTKKHPGYFEVNEFSLKEMSVAVAAPHYLDAVPWEDREVKQRFLHEHSVSFSRNWFGSLPRKRGNDRHREPFARPDSMVMPMAHRQDRNWPEEWYTTWQSRRMFGVDDDYDDDSSAGSYSSGSSRSTDDHTNQTGSLRSGSALSESIYTRETRETDSFLDEATTAEYTWDDYDEDAPECGHIVNVKQKIGERVSRVTPYTTTSLRRSRWRRKYFPRGTFPY